MDRAIVAAALELIAELGVHEFRMDDVADRAGVGKATIYRRYASKDELVTAAVTALVSEIGVPDTGSTRGDLLALMLDAVQVYGDSVAGRVMPSVVEAMRRDPELADELRGGFLARRRDALRCVVDRGVKRGDLRRGLDVGLVLDVLGGPLFYRLLITDGPIDDELAVGVVDLIMRGFAPGTPRRHNAKEKRT